jgi:hypothetical protein
MKIKDVILENAERPYVCVHAKKGKCEVTANSSYAAAKKAADKWKLKSTAGIDAYLADVKHTATNEAKEIDDWDDQDDYEEEDNPYKASGLPNIVAQIEKAQDMFKEFSDDIKFKKPTIKFVDDSVTVVSDAEYNKNKDKKTLPEKYLKLFLDEYFKLKDKKQMQNDAIMSRKGFIGAIKNAMDGKYGGEAEKSQYHGMMRSKNTTTQYSY